jgi:hypothetical protein
MAPGAHPTDPINDAESPGGKFRVLRVGLTAKTRPNNTGYRCLATLVVAAKFPPHWDEKLATA